MRLHNNLVRAVVQALSEIFNQQNYADKVLERVLKSDPRWGARDRAFIAEGVYEIVRWWRLLLELSGIGYREDAAFISEKHLWRVFGTWWLFTEQELPTWEEFEGLAASKIAQRYKDLKGTRRIAQSLPDWLDELGKKELGDKRWEQEMKASNEVAEVVLRVNTLKSTLGALQQQLKESGIDTRRLRQFPDALVLEERQNIFRHPLFKGGFFEIQDAGSQAIAQFLEVSPEMRVIDACAGAGGKALHLAALMKNKGRILAMDVEERKLAELRKRASRAGANIIETRLISSTKIVKRLADSADRLLLDVPCSGLGVLRRNPDAKWKLKADFIDTLRQTQRDILERYSRMLKVGGKMVYATCSILPSENQEQVAWFMERYGAQFELQAETQLYSSEEGFDGFYMALLERKK